ncbi:MOSC domain-containing protein, partial [Kaarinaea lacus]
IGLRPNRDTPMLVTAQAIASVDQGLEGDRFSGSISGKRQVTLIQAEHLSVVAALLKRHAIDPALVRRNIVVSGINLLSLKETTFYVGEARLEMTGLCHPCSKMETILGQGGYNAMRGHGGITAKVVQNGVIHLGDRVYPERN